MKSILFKPSCSAMIIAFFISGCGIMPDSVTKNGDSDSCYSVTDVVEGSIQDIEEIEYIGRGGAQQYFNVKKSGDFERSKPIYQILGKDRQGAAFNFKVSRDHESYEKLHRFFSGMHEFQVTYRKQHCDTGSWWKWKIKSQDKEFVFSESDLLNGVSLLNDIKIMVENHLEGAELPE